MVTWRCGLHRLGSLPLSRAGARTIVVNVDCLTYAANLSSLENIAGDNRYSFHQTNNCDGPAISSILRCEQPDAIMHLAAESHVDRSITSPAAFVETNIRRNVPNCWKRPLVGTARLFRKEQFRLLHVSTDEVFGSLGDKASFTPDTPYQPSSPYSASKAASDHLAMAWQRAYGLPVVLSNCSNNYSPYHFTDKLIPLMITNALLGRHLPIYSSGAHVRDWPSRLKIMPAR